jgi:hypothetical protein
VSHEWAGIAYRRQPTALNAHNLACGERDKAVSEKLFRKALEHDQEYTRSAAIIAKMVEVRNPGEAKTLREMIVRVLESDIHSSETSLDELRRLHEAARKIEKGSVAEKASAEIERRERDVAMRDTVFHEENLAQGRDSLLGQEP